MRHKTDIAGEVGLQVLNGLELKGHLRRQLFRSQDVSPPALSVSAIPAPAVVFLTASKNEVGYPTRRRLQFGRSLA